MIHDTQNYYAKKGSDVNTIGGLQLTSSPTNNNMASIQRQKCLCENFGNQTEGWNTPVKPKITESCSEKACPHPSGKLAECGLSCRLTAVPFSFGLGLSLSAPAIKGPGSYTHQYPWWEAHQPWSQLKNLNRPYYSSLRSSLSWSRISPDYSGYPWYQAHWTPMRSWDWLQACCTAISEPVLPVQRPTQEPGGSIFRNLAEATSICTLGNRPAVCASSCAWLRAWK